MHKLLIVSSFLFASVGPVATFPAGPGRVVRINPLIVSWGAQGSESASFYRTPKTEIWVGGRRGSESDLRVGAMVTVSVHLGGPHMLVADKIVVQPQTGLERRAKPAGGHPITAAIRLRADRLWNAPDTIVILAHTHIDWGPSTSTIDPSRVAASLEEFRDAGITAAVIALTIDDGEYVDGPGGAKGWHCIPQNDPCWNVRFSNRLAAIENYVKGDRAGRTVIAHGVQDVLNAKRRGQFAVIIGSEGTNHLQTDSAELLRADIQRYRARGWLVSQLTHDPSLQNIGHDSRCTKPHRFVCGSRVDGSDINALGLRVAQEMQAQGILVDLRHLDNNPDLETFLGVLNSDKPVMISHAECEGVTSAPEGLEKRIFDSGHGTGVIGCHFLAPRSPLGPRLASIHSWDLDHPGTPRLIKHYGLGPDYCPGYVAEDESCRGRDCWWVHRAGAIRAELVPELIAAGFKDAELKDLLGGNLLRAFEKAWIQMPNAVPDERLPPGCPLALPLLQGCNVPY